MTKQEQVNHAVQNWQDLGLPDPEADKTAFVRALVSAGILPEGQAERSAARMVRLAAVVKQDVPEAPQSPPGGVVRRNGIRKDRYRIERHEDGDVYVFYPRKGEAFGIAAHHVQDMKRAYANKPDGLGWTVNQVATHWKINRREFEFVKTELGWTHDQDEFTREEHLELTTEQLLEDREQRSRWLLGQKAKQQELAELKRLAALGGDFEHRTEALRVAVQGYEPPRGPTEAGDYRVPGSRLVVIPLSDLHIGGPGSLNTEDELLAWLSELPLQGAEVLPVWNGDLFHVDTPSFKTTRGTPQDHITYDPYTGLELVYSAGLKVMTRLKQRAGKLLETIVTAGNHDEMSSYHWQLALNAAGYKTDDQRGEALKVMTWHDELLAFEHGDGGRGKPQNFIDSLNKRHRPELGKTKRTWLFTGHLHHVKQLDMGSAMWTQLPSPAPQDGWHRKQNYEGQRALQAFEYERGRGLVRTHWRLL